HEGEDDHDDHHDEETIDPHVWLSPVLAQTIARNMLDTLISNDPEGKSVYEANLDALIADLTTLDKELMEVMAPLQGEILFVYHPAFGYFGDHYGLVQEAIETGGKEPSAAALEEIIEHAHEESVRIIVVQPEFSQNSAKAVADAIGGVVIPMAPLEKDYINNLKMMAQTLRDNL
ncbi:MAG: zinc ABC transporter substrate-binding protein, partial [Spirochaetales bacterium]|nr:zinc ABC transporter substrate-binding protein [Spirochaetales bacterium]